MKRRLFKVCFFFVFPSEHCLQVISRQDRLAGSGIRNWARLMSRVLLLGSGM